MATVIRWGIIGLGAIARKFASDLAHVPDARLVAVGSRSWDKATAFAAEFKAARAYASYQELVADREVDAVYIATPHPLHREDAILCLEGGKAVLCEKPFAVNHGELEQVIAVARHARVFLMEAMWTRFLPAMVRVREWIASGAIGDARMLSADFGFRCPWEPASRLLDPALGGGALLDVGVYTVALAQQLFGPPQRITGLATIGETGVDEQSAFISAHAGGRLAVLSCAVRTATPQEARIDGESGRITIPAFWHASSARLAASERSEQIELPFQGNGYQYEAIEVGRCLRAGLLESPLMTHAESLQIMRTMDELRQQWGLRYPADGGTGMAAPARELHARPD
jgi:predicted dehydrogenase